MRNSKYLELSKLLEDETKQMSRMSNSDLAMLCTCYAKINPDFPLGDFSHIDEAAMIEVAKITGTCSNGNH
mgnify:FL=1